MTKRFTLFAALAALLLIAAALAFLFFFRRSDPLLGDGIRFVCTPPAGRLSHV